MKKLKKDKKKMPKINTKEKKSINSNNEMEGWRDIQYGKVRRRTRYLEG